MFEPEMEIPTERRQYCEYCGTELDLTLDADGPREDCVRCGSSIPL